MLLGGQHPAVSGETAAVESGAPTELCLLILIVTCAFFSFEQYTHAHHTSTHIICPCQANMLGQANFAFCLYQKLTDK